MSLKFLLGRPNFFHGQTASSALFSNKKLITAWEVSPFSQYQYGVSSDSQTLYLGSFAYASMLGTLWRGTINYDIIVFKTCFHQGRFAVVFLPETNLADVPATLGDLLTTNYNVVCNLKDRQDEMGRTTFRVASPYVSNVGWKKTYHATSNTSNPGPDATTLRTKVGCMAIYSLVDLSYSEQVSGSVSFLIAHSAGEDFQIARPTIQLSPGFQTRSAQSDVGPVFIPEDENLLVPSHKSRDITAQTTGEYFHSLRALMKRYGNFGSLERADDYVGLRTRHMAEDPTTGRRVMSRLNFKDYVSPTPWYMVSFLYRFYNGSSNLKLIPTRPASICESFLKFDEDVASQTTVNDQESIGQPVFSQQQQVSNVYEIRTPYYRAVRCDVVNSIEPPVYGDVRTCIKISNTGGTADVSKLYEAAGDDFNFFFMVGPPPMMDIDNLKTTGAIFPTGKVVTVSTASVTATTDEGLFVRTGLITVTPTVVAGTYHIATSTKDFVTVTYTDATTELVPITSCRIYRTGTSIYLEIPTDPNPLKVPNTTAITASVKALDTFDVLIDAP
nr:MAG: capsid protein [Crogonang virus 84]